MLVDPGYQTVDRYVIDGVARMPAGDRNLRFVEYFRRREAIEAIPGVSALAYGSPVPGWNLERYDTVAVPNPGNDSSPLDVHVGVINERFVNLLDIKLLHGRVPGDSETDIVVVNRTLAHEFWGRDDVVGESVSGNYRWGVAGAEVIGVVENLSFEHPKAAVPPYIFSTLGSPAVPIAAVVETQLSASDLLQEVKRVTTNSAVDFDVTDVHSLGSLRKELLGEDRARGLLTIAAATVALVMVAVGFYGTQQFLVAAGRREYAIRASLGAGPKSLGRLVVRRGLALGIPGFVLGVPLVFIVVSWLRDEFLSREISSFSVALITVVGLMPILLIASLGPARAAKATQPATLLRQE
jgi:hypothetical protein